ncbi:hypothetical protein WJX72_004224 [[Myrmecia] bisecta]|uniref:Uncharacterized protein n=1 Tax=[Myrmecia] bisecta TaxID=41462 RepID=A0AAW1PX17_9CHLO
MSRERRRKNYRAKALAVAGQMHAGGVRSQLLGQPPAEAAELVDTAAKAESQSKEGAGMEPTQQHVHIQPAAPQPRHKAASVPDEAEAQAEEDMDAAIEPAELNEPQMPAAAGTSANGTVASRHAGAEGRTCPRCHTGKPTTAFYVSARTGRLSSYCKACDKLRQQQIRKPMVPWFCKPPYKQHLLSGQAVMLAYVPLELLEGSAAADNAVSRLPMDCVAFVHRLQVRQGTATSKGATDLFVQFEDGRWATLGDANDFWHSGDHDSLDHGAIRLLGPTGRKFRPQLWPPSQWTTAEVLSWPCMDNFDDFCSLAGEATDGPWRLTEPQFPILGNRRMTPADISWGCNHMRTLRQCYATKKKLPPVLGERLARAVAREYEAVLLPAAPADARATGAACASLPAAASSLDAMQLSVKRVEVLDVLDGAKRGSEELVDFAVDNPRAMQRLMELRPAAAGRAG